MVSVFNDVGCLADGLRVMIVLIMGEIFQPLILESLIDAIFSVFREVFYLSLLGLSSFGIGYWTLNRLGVRPDFLGEIVIYSVGLGLGELAVIGFLVSVSGLLWWEVISTLLLFGATLAGFQIWRDNLIHWARKGDHYQIFSRKISPFNLLLIIVMAISLLHSLIVYALAPPLNWDEISYHLALSKIYMEHHGITYVPYIAYSNMPMLMEILYSFALVLGSEVLTHLITLTTSLVTGAALIVFSKKYFSTQIGLLAAALYFSADVVKRLSGVALVDVSLACFSFLTILAFWEWHQKRQWGWLFLSALFGGFTASVKLPGAAIVLILASILGYQGLVLRKDKLQTVLGQIVLFCLVSFLVVFPWYIKSYLYTGDPIWPFGYRFFGGADWDDLGGEYLYGYLHTTNLSLTPRNFFVWVPWYLLNDPARFGGYAIGWFILIFAPLSIFVKSDKIRIVAYLLSICISFYVVWFFLTHQTRFLLPIVPVLCLLSAYSLYWFLQTKIKVLQLILYATVLIYFVLGLPLIDGPQRNLFLNRLQYVMGQVSKEEFLSREINVYDVFKYANTNLPNDARILLAPFETRGYYLDKDYVWANLISQRYIRFEKIPNADILAETLRELDISFIIVNPNMIFTNIRYWDHFSFLFLDLLEKHLEPIYEKDGIILYRLRDC